MASQCRHIAIAIERTSEFGRQFILGVANFFDGKEDWQLDLLSPSKIHLENIRDYDGWICRITNKRVLGLLHDSGKPVVDALCLTPAADFSSVRTDHNAIATLAAEHFLSHRFTNFGFCGYRHVPFSDLRRDAFVHCLKARGIQPNIYRPPYKVNRSKILTPSQRQQIAEGHLGTAEDAHALMTWLKRLPKPVAILCCDDFRASDVVQLCKRAGLEIPKDIAVLGIDNDPVYCLFGSPRISSIDPDATSLGYSAAEMLLETLSANITLKPLTRMIPPKGIIMRASTDTYPGAPMWLRSALTYIENEIGNGISASDVFRHVGYSRTFVEKTFRNFLNKTVQDIISEARIRTAKQLLLATTSTIKEIAAQTGYGSTEYFTRAFCAAVGLPPATYRRQSHISAPHI